jgi:hypothetical protein
MLVQARPPLFECKDGVASLTLWLCECFDMSFSFREALLQIQCVLGGPTACSWDLPPELPCEDHAEGGFAWQDRRYSIYFERGLGYLQFSSRSPQHVQDLQFALGA